MLLKVSEEHLPVYFLILHTETPSLKQKCYLGLIHLNEDSHNKEILSETTVSSSLLMRKLNTGDLFNTDFSFLVDLFLWLKTKANSCPQQWYWQPHSNAPPEIDPATGSCPHCWNGEKFLNASFSALGFMLQKIISSYPRNWLFSILG